MAIGTARKTGFQWSPEPLFKTQVHTGETR